MIKSKANQMLSNLKLNLKVKKILSPDEKLFLTKERQITMNDLQFSINNLQNDLKIFTKRDNKKYIVKIRLGEKNEKNISLARDELILNVSEIEKEEQLNEIVKIQKIVKFEKKHILKYSLSEKLSSASFNDLFKLGNIFCKKDPTPINK